MHYMLSDEQISFFKSHAHLEVEGLNLEPIIDLITQEKTDFNLAVKNKKIEAQIRSLKLQRLAAQLTKQRPLQFAFDCVVTTSPFSFKDQASVTNIQCGIAINLITKQLQFIYFDYELEILDPTYIICFAKFPSRYKYNPQDPLTHKFKNFGFNVGDAIHYGP